MTECYFEIQGEKLLWFLLTANFRFHWTSIACLACPVTSQLFDFIFRLKFFYTVFYHYCTPMQPLFGLTPAAHKLEVKACLFCCTTSCSSCWGEAVVCKVLLRKFHIYFFKKYNHPWDWTQDFKFTIYILQFRIFFIFYNNN